MTEAEWITTKLPLYMLREYPVAWDERKLFLASYHCLRNSWVRLSDTQRNYVEAVARFIDDETSVEERDRARNECESEFRLSAFDWRKFHTQEAVRHFSHRIGQRSLIEVFRNLADATFEKERQCDLIREVFGNPFRPVDVSPWLTSDVVALARGIYDERAFDRMPILADALQDAGCDNVNVLDHCRGPGEHVRGCWVIDLLLGKG